MAINLYGACSKTAQDYGALAVTFFGCSEVSGRVIPIERKQADVQQMAEITNFNFHVSSSQPAVVAPSYAPGPTQGFDSTSKPVNKLV